MTFLKAISTVVLLGGIGLISACGGGGGGGSAGAVGGVVGASNTVGYVGVGVWQGPVTIQNQALYVQFLVYNNLCSGVACSAAGGFLNLAISTQSSCGGGYSAGTLPGSVQIVMTNYVNGYQGQALNQCASGFINGSNNGMVINYNGLSGSNGFYGYGYGSTYGQPYNQQPINNGTPMLQIATQWTDGTHVSMNVQIIYNGTQIASGTISGSGSTSGAYGVGGVQSAGYYPGQPSYYNNYGGGYSYFGAYRGR